MTNDQTWNDVKRRMQKRWGITPPGSGTGPTWTSLADHLRDRAVRVGGHLLDVVREVATETSATVSEASHLLQDDASRASAKVKSASGKARTGFDTAKATMEELADSVRDGLVDGVSKSRQDRDLPKALAESVGIAAGAFVSAVVGRSKEGRPNDGQATTDSSATKPEKPGL